MPVKYVDNLKNPGSRAAGQEWQAALGIEKLTSSEWDYAAVLSRDKNGNIRPDEEIARIILEEREIRKRKKKK